MSNEIAKNYGFDEEVTVVTYPASMELKNKSWFNECCVVNDTKGIQIFGLQAYVVPVRLLRNG